MTNLTAEELREIDRIVAMEIYEAIGGGRFLALTGASGLKVIQCGLRLRIPTLMQQYCNHIEIELHGNDGQNKLYRFTFFTGREGNDIRHVYDGLFAWQLPFVFQAKTGLKTTV